MMTDTNTFESAVVDAELPMLAQVSFSEYTRDPGRSRGTHHSHVQTFTSLHDACSFAHQQSGKSHDVVLTHVRSGVRWKVDRAGFKLIEPLYTSLLIVSASK